MEDEYIELSTVDESDQIKRVSGGLGYDTIFSDILAETLASGNSHTITGDEDGDSINAAITAAADTGNSAAATGNTTSASGGDGEDDVASILTATAQEGGSAEVSGNSVLLRGDDDGDFIIGRIIATASGGIAAVCSDNVMTLDGGSGDDHVGVILESVAEEPGSIATMIGNQVFVYGGEGNDRLGFRTRGAIDNHVVLDGGAGIDVIGLGDGRQTEDLTFDFRRSYDQVL